MNCRSESRRLLLAGIAALLWPVALHSAAAAASSHAAPASLAIHYIEAAPDPQRTANRTLAYFTVLDKAGRPLLDLSPDRFDILEDGSPVPFEQISVASDPMAVVLAIDTSGSMLARTPSGSRSIDAVKEAAAAFVSLLSAGDRIALFTFDNETELRLDFTDDHRAAINAVRRISATPEAFTRLYDTALAAVKKAAEFPRGRRAVILLTDGRDEKRGGLPFSVHPVRDVIDEAATRTVRVPIYTIGAGPKVDREALGRISALTGGRSLIAGSAAEVEALFRTVADQLKHPYRLLYFSRAPSGEHSLVVKIHLNGATAQDERRFWSPPLPVLPPPVVSIASPANEQPVLGDPTVQLALSPEDQVVRIRAYVDGRLIMDKDRPPLDRFRLATDKLAPGRHLLRVEALNRAGLPGAAETTFGIPMPVVSISGPQTTRSVRGTVSLEFRVDSEAPVEKLRLRVDGVVKDEQDRSPFKPFSWDTAGLSPGGHSVQIEAIDAYGRSGAAETMFQVEPTSANRLLPLIAGAAAVGFLLLGYRLYRRQAGKAPSSDISVAGPQAAGQPPAAPAPEPAEDDETVFFDGRTGSETAPEAVVTIVESPGLDPGTKFEIRGAVSVGRHEKSDIRLVDKSVSRKHAEIYFDGLSYFLRDLGSRYGTLLNRHRISLDAAPLFDGAQIKLGPRSTLEFAIRSSAGPDDATQANPFGGGEEDDTLQVKR